jgi:hypothetical protein
MKVKLFEKVAIPHINGVSCGYMKEREINNVEHLKHYIDQGVDIRVKDGDKFVKGAEYFAPKEESKEEIKTAQVDAPINGVDFEELFDNHWKTQIKEIEALDNAELVKQAIKYAEANDISDTVLEKAKAHLSDLQD